MERIYIGIDPGFTGAMATIYPDGKVEIVDWISTNEALNALVHRTILDQVSIKATLEKVHAFPGQGVSSTFKFGQSYGIWIGRFEAYRIPFDYVTPRKWKKAIFDSAPAGDQKLMSLDRARRLFPACGPDLTRKSDHNRADAILIAEYGRRMDV
jgi:Holliday junction resolvasome RuvABC endonuclease subunit